MPALPESPERKMGEMNKKELQSRIRAAQDRMQELRHELSMLDIALNEVEEKE